MRLRHLLAIAILLVPLAAACAEEGATADPQVLNVTAKDYGFSGVPETISGGRVDLTFTNEGKVDHEFGLIDLSGRSLEDFGKVAAKFMEGGPIPEWMKTAAVPGEIGPGKTLETSFELPEGDYLLFCALTDAPGDKEGKPHVQLGMHQNVAVEGDNGADMPNTGGEFVSTDYSFVIPDTLQAGKNTYTFRNASPEQWHFMHVESYPKGVTAQAAEEAFSTLLTLEQGKPPPPGTPMSEEEFSTGIFSAGLAQTFEATFKPGTTYIAVCFVQDRTGGAPHAVQHKMYKAFTVSE
jgi:hypothetical protein